MQGEAIERIMVNFVNFFFGIDDGFYVSAVGHNQMIFIQVSQAIDIAMDIICSLRIWI